MDLYSLTSHSAYPAGTVLKIDRGFYTHYGMVDNSGRVIHKTEKRGVVRESLARFAEGKQVTVDSTITSANPALAVAKAKSRIGWEEYDLLFSNCEHFVRWCLGLKVESPQVQKGILFGTGGLVALKSHHPVIQASGVAGVLAAVFTPEEKSPIVPFALMLAGIGLYALMKNNA